MQMLCAFPSLIYTLKNALDLRIRIEFPQLFVEYLDPKDTWQLIARLELKL